MALTLSVGEAEFRRINRLEDITSDPGVTAEGIMNICHVFM